MIKLKSLLESIADYRLVVESPMRIGKMNMSQLEDNSNNYAFTSEIKKKLINQTDQFESYNIYSYKVGDTIYDLFVDGDYTIALFSYSTSENSMIEKKVWQEGSHIGLCRKIVFDYYLQKFGEIISDGLHTELGEKYWKKLIPIAIQKGYIVTLFINGKRLPLEQFKLDTYFSNNPKSQEIRFSIRK